MSEIAIRIEGRAGRITLNRPNALNALTYDMAMAINDALIAWEDDDQVDLIIIDAIGEKAFCAGGDIADLYQSGTKGDYDFGRQFWADEYRMNARLFEFPKPVVSLMQGFTMGGGVGIGCHGSHRIVGDSSRIAMPECGIGLVPDVGGSLILARAPGRLGEYLGTTAGRLDAGDAIFAGFADYYLPETSWPDLITKLEETGDHTLIDHAAQPAPASKLSEAIDQINGHFAGEAFSDILTSLRTTEDEFSNATLKTLSRNSPLAMACTVEMIHRLRSASGIRQALDMEYRFTSRAMEHADFLEGIRAAIIDKDRAPKWRHGLDDVKPVDVSKMLMPLGQEALSFEKKE